MIKNKFLETSSNRVKFFNEEDLTVPFDVMDLDLNETNFVSQSSDVTLKVVFDLDTVFTSRV